MTVRWITAIAVLASALVHLKEWLDGMRQVHVIGPLFVINIVAGIVIAILLVTWQHWVPPFLALGFGATTLGGFVIAATWGLFGDHELWQGGYVWTAAITEVIAIVGGLYLLAQQRRTSSTAAPASS